MGVVFVLLPKEEPRVPWEAARYLYLSTEAGLPASPLQRSKDAEGYITARPKSQMRLQTPSNLPKVNGGTGASIEL